jgi:membrane associated rhomboid family serine protease
VGLGFGPGGLPPGLKVILIVTIAAFPLQFLLQSITGASSTLWFGLSWPTLRGGDLWRPFTYMLLHGGLWHLLLNMLMLFMFGRDVEWTLGTRRFVRFYVACGVLAGIGWMLLSGSGRAYCIGASGAVFGVLGAYAAFFPARRVTLLLFFVLPVTLSARALAVGMAVLSLYSMMSGDRNIAHAAHLAGGAAGYLFALRHERGGRWAPVIGGRRRPVRPAAGAPPPTPAEVDAVLDKISREGLRSLTRDERDLLARASAARARRPVRGR